MTAGAPDVPSSFLTGEAIRRVVVGTGADGRSTVLHDGVSRHRHAHREYPGVTVTELWSLHPEDSLRSDEDPAGPRAGLRPARAGESRYYSVRIDAGQEIPLHVTPTVDYHVVVAGQVTCVLESGEATLRAGDVLVIKGAAHGWRTPPGSPFVSFAVMVGAAEAESVGLTCDDQTGGIEE
jgi:quercetin dioxygenase-like cupin family protein